MLTLIILMIINFGISWWNAHVAGLIWIDSKALGGFPRLLAWCAAIQSTAGFTMCFAAVLGGAAFLTGLLPPAGIKAMAGMTYLLILLPVLGTGLVITVHSWIMAWRERSFANLAIAGWNTYASISNISGALNGGISGAFKEIGDLFKDEDTDTDKPVLFIAIIFLILAALVFGIVLTRAVMRGAMGRLPAPARA